MSLKKVQVMHQSWMGKYVSIQNQWWKRPNLERQNSHKHCLIRIYTKSIPLCSELCNLQTMIQCMDSLISVAQAQEIKMESISIFMICYCCSTAKACSRQTTLAYYLPISAVQKDTMVNGIERCCPASGFNYHIHAVTMEASNLLKDKTIISNKKCKLKYNHGKQLAERFCF